MNILHKKLLNEIPIRPSFKVGAVIDLVYEDGASRSRIRKFTGLCIATTVIGYSFRHLLRNVINNVSIELSIDSSSTLVISIARAPIYKKLSNKKAKFYYLRTKRLVDSKV